MTPSFNLIDQPWIPCLQQNSNVITLSLYDTLAQSHQIFDLAADSPMENAALYRFLLAILHRVFGPANAEQWGNLWRAKSFDLSAIEAYLQEWYSRFDLFSTKHPFLQHLDERFKTKDEVVSLKHGTGFKPSDWFNHEVITLDSRLSPAQAARDLLSVLAFGFGGTSGLSGMSHYDAPCAKGVIFIVQGDNLKQTLLLNLNRYIEDFSAFNPDQPTWELDDPYEIERTQPFGHLDYLTFPSRRIILYLNPDKLAQGEMEVHQYRLGLGLHLDGVTDPMKHYYKSKTSGLLPLAFSEDRQLWRNSDSLFAVQREADGSSLPPVTFTWLGFLAENSILSRHATYRCKAMGIAKNQGRADFARQEQFPLPLSLLTDKQRLDQLKDAIDSVRGANGQLERALARMGMYLHLNDPTKYNWKSYRISHPKAEKDLNSVKTTSEEIKNWMSYTGADRVFWASLDAPFLRYLEELSSWPIDDLHTLQHNWREKIYDTTLSAYRRATQYTNQTPRAYKAIAHGSNYLKPYLFKHFSAKGKGG